MFLHRGTALHLHRIPLSQEWTLPIADATSCPDVPLSLLHIVKAKEYLLDPQTLYLANPGYICLTEVLVHEGGTLQLYEIEVFLL